MKTKIKIFYAGFGYGFLFYTLLLGSGCKKFLEVKSNAKLVVPQSVKDAQGLLDDAAVMNFTSTPGYGESSADDYFLPPAALTAKGATGADVYLWKQVDYRYGNDWSKGYLAVYNSNLALEVLGKMERSNGNAASFDNVRGSALFFKAYYYLLLTAQYGLAYQQLSSSSDPGIVLRSSSDYNVPSVRSDVKSCYLEVIRNLEESLPLLPEHGIVLTRPSKGAAYALLARTYLYMHDYAKALGYVEAALKINPQLMDYNADPELNITSNAPFKKFNKETVFYSELFAGFDLHGTSAARVDTVLYGSYGVNDLRRTAFFRASSLYQQFKGSYAGSGTTLFSGIATDELYLTRAECKAFLDDVTGAMADLNLLLQKRFKSTVPYLPLTAVNRMEALRIIRLERRKELLMRGLRWADIKRLNVEGEHILPSRLKDGKLFSLEPGSRFYALPLPIDVIQQSGIAQN